ncbi:MAG: hypothetical protein KF720_03830 [Rubrivivax sp.]|nr:hypothetical protein [Rubrivivax sp.]
MLTKSTLAVLSRAADEGLPRTIDEADPRVDLAAFRELYRAGLIEAIDASGDRDVYLEATITLKGREVLRSELAARQPWWAAFDRRVAVVALIVAVLSLAAGVDMLKLK